MKFKHIGNLSLVVYNALNICELSIFCYKLFSERAIRGMARGVLGFGLCRFSFSRQLDAPAWTVAVAEFPLNFGAMDITCLINRGPSSYVLTVSGDHKLEDLKDAMAAHSSLQFVEHDAILQVSFFITRADVFRLIHAFFRVLLPMSVHAVV